SRTGWSKKEHRSNRTRRVGHSSLEDLIKRRERPNGSVLSDYAVAQPFFKLLCHSTLGCRIKGYKLSFLTVANHFHSLFQRPYLILFSVLDSRLVRCQLVSIPSHFFQPP